MARSRYLNSIWYRMDTQAMNPKEIESTKEYGKKLEKLGVELAEIKFSYKVKEETAKEYWIQRIQDFKRYQEKGAEYYNQVYAMMNLASQEEGHLFLLRQSKLRQLCATLLHTMEKIRDNPSVINSKDRQQSLWSREVKDQITEQSNMCLKHEKDMNILFREFYDTHLKEIL